MVAGVDQHVVDVLVEEVIIQVEGEATLTVGASQFNNTGSAGEVNFHKVEDQPPRKDEYETGFGIFGLLALLGYLILGLILVKHLPGIFLAVDGEVRHSTLLRTLLGFVMIIASFIAVLLVALVVIGAMAKIQHGLQLVAAVLGGAVFVLLSRHSPVSAPRECLIVPLLFLLGLALFGWPAEHFALFGDSGIYPNTAALLRQVPRTRRELPLDDLTALGLVEVGGSIVG